MGAADIPGEVSGGPINSSAAGERRRLLDEWCANQTVAEITDTLLALGIPVGPVRTIPEVTKDPHTWEREMLVKMPDPVAGEMYLPGVAMKLSATPGEIGPVPTPGQHTDEVLSRLLGYNPAKLAELRAAKIIS